MVTGVLFTLFTTTLGVKLVTVFSKADCQPCRLTKMALDRGGVAYTERRVDEDPEALAAIKELGYLQVPVVITDSDHWSGLRPDKISQIVSVS